MQRPNRGEPQSNATSNRDDSKRLSRLRPSIPLTDTGRVEAFSDGVFAVVVTLLVSSTARLRPDAMVSGEVPA
jgi:hypothetical protein